MTTAKPICGPGQWCGRVRHGRPFDKALDCNRCYLAAQWGLIPGASATPARGGPGAELKYLLSRLGLTPGGCSCEARARQMDAWGAAGCAAHRAEIVDWLREEADKRSWWDKGRAAAAAVVSGLAFSLDPLDPFGSLVDEAVRRASPPAVPFVPRAGDPPAGVVIGYSRWPALVELQLALIRETCGPVPVLVSADPDPARPAELAELVAVCGRRGAELVVSPERIGHTGGDLAAYGRGVTWAAGRGLKVVAKLSQRFLMTRPRWLQDGAAELLLSALPAAARFAAPAPPPDKWGAQLRTEAMLLDVTAWNRPPVLARLAPRKRFNDRPDGYHAEEQILDLIRGELGGAYWPWELIPADRYGRGDGVVWRMANTAEEYRALAAARGITLPADFKVGGWEAENRRGEYDAG